MKILYCVWCALALCGCSAECLRILQNAAYRPQRGYFKVYFSCYFAILAVLCAFSWFWWFCFAEEAVLCGIYSLSAAIVNLVPRKCSLKFTKRILRMLTAEFAVLCPCCFVALHWWIVFLPLFVLVAWLICLPTEAVISKKYLANAQAKLFEGGVTVIAITGSFGKTSFKDMLCSLLDGATAPPGNCNTPLGIAKFINSGGISRNAKYLILEFGARNRGDIAFLCKLFHPKFAVVTGVCEQHLSTFKTLQSIRLTKRELVECLPRDGLCLLCDDSVKDFAQAGICQKVLRQSVEISDVRISPKGLTFEACESVGAASCQNIGSTKKNFEVHLPQITPHSSTTFAFCATLCALLGQPFVKTVQNTVKVEQVPHRMQVLHNGSFFIIDDSYNANLRGVESCCDVMLRLDGAAKAVISQGITEGGKKQRELNIRCGKMLGEVFDVVIVLGKNKKSVFKGAVSASKATVKQAKTLKQAVEFARQYVLNGGYLVFQNDLPDLVNA